MLQETELLSFEMIKSIHSVNMAMGLEMALYFFYWPPNIWEIVIDEEMDSYIQLLAAGYIWYYSHNHKVLTSE